VKEIVKQNDEEKVVPLTDPGQISLFARLQSDLSRQKCGNVVFGGRLRNLSFPVAVQVEDKSVRKQLKDVASCHVGHSGTYLITKVKPRSQNAGRGFSQNSLSTNERGAKF
jgi:hypothetical protein